MTRVTTKAGYGSVAADPLVSIQRPPSDMDAHQRSLVDPMPRSLNHVLRLIILSRRSLLTGTAPSAYNVVTALPISDSSPAPVPPTFPLAPVYLTRLPRPR